MKIHPPTLAIDKDDPFKDALFGRKAFADSLTTLLRNVSSNLVVLVHAPWGEGKTTFARMWRADLLRQKLNVIYFDAYAADYFNDPFVCFSGEILKLAEERLSEGKGALARTEFKKAAVEVGKKLAGLAAKVAIKTATMGVIEEAHIKQIKEISEVASGLGEIGAKAIEHKIESYTTEKDALGAFKKRLAELAILIREEQQFPLTIIVDELDRCRPDFALGLLERIKHLFDVENVAFVLLVNRDQIEGYIKKAYGYVDAHEYLQKFANLFVVLPTDVDLSPQYEKGRADYCQILFEHLEMSKPRTGSAGTDPGFLLECLKTFAEHFHLTFRQLENVFATITVYYGSRNPNEYTRELLVAVLAVLKVARPTCTRRLGTCQISKDSFFAQTKLDKIAKSNRLDPEWAHKYIAMCLMSEEELESALSSEKEAKATYVVSYEEIRSHLPARPHRILPMLCSQLDRFALKP